MLLPESVQVLVISLPGSIGRRKKVAAEMTKVQIEWSFLEAIDGANLRLNDIKAYKPDKVKRLLGFELTDKELGCYLSHFKAWQLCIDKNIPTVIFEDDFVLLPHFEKVLTYLVNTYKQWEIIRLQALADSAYSVVQDAGDFKIIKNAQDPLGATAYMVNPASANRLIEQSSEIFEPVDHFIEHFEKHGLTMLAVSNYPVTVVDATNATSTINDRPERMPIKGISKLKRSILRAIDRSFSKNPWFPK
jgi:glycosyl transferase, family 25